MANYDYSCKACGEETIAKKSASEYTQYTHNTYTQHHMYIHITRQTQPVKYLTPANRNKFCHTLPGNYSVIFTVCGKNMEWEKLVYIESLSLIFICKLFLLSSVVAVYMHYFILHTQLVQISPFTNILKPFQYITMYSINALTMHVDVVQVSFRLLSLYLLT